MTTMFVTGAGISAAAGIATYRDAGSSWTNADLEKKSHANRYGNHLDELWDRHWGPLSQTMAVAIPTYAHKAIAEFGGLVATQNIDDLHDRAGSDTVHVHGVAKAKCMRCKSQNIDDWGGNGAPVCLDCSAKKTRPDVVLFGETLDKKQFRRLELRLHKTTNMVVVGTSLNVYPLAGLVMDAIMTKGCTTTLITKGDTPLTKWFDKVYDAEADSVIDEVLAELDKDPEVV